MSARSLSARELATMSEALDYPRVLLVLTSKVKAADQTNLLIRTEFGAWPRERLAQIHSTADPPGHGDFCGRYYQLRGSDRAFWRLFQILRAPVFSLLAPNPIAEPRVAGAHSRWRSGGGRAIRRMADWLVHSGLWEICFPLRLSENLIRFVEEFRPDLVYCQGYTIGFATLPRLIADRFDVPICFQVTDDWPSSVYRVSPVRWLLRRRARQLIRQATVRLAFGAKMREAYERRYRVPFEVSYHLDDPDRFGAERSEPKNPIPTIVYVGGLGHRRYEAIQDLSAAVSALADRIGPVRIRVFGDGIPHDAPTGLRQTAHVTFEPMPAHHDVPDCLACADALFLPESFTERRSAIEYSISTKAHLYMASRRPILVYGPPYSGVVDYASSEKWGVVVTRRDRGILIAGLETVLRDAAATKMCDRRAAECFRRNHDLETGRARFRRLLSAVVSERIPGSDMRRTLVKRDA